MERIGVAPHLRQGLARDRGPAVAADPKHAAVDIFLTERADLGLEPFGKAIDTAQIDHRIAHRAQMAFEWPI